MTYPHVSHERHHHSDPCTGQHKARHHSCAVHLQKETKKGNFSWVLRWQKWHRIMYNYMLK